MRNRAMEWAYKMIFEHLHTFTLWMYRPIKIGSINYKTKIFYFRLKLIEPSDIFLVLFNSKFYSLVSIKAMPFYFNKNALKSHFFGTVVPYMGASKYIEYLKLFEKSTIICEHGCLSILIGHLSVISFVWIYWIYFKPDNRRCLFLRSFEYID